MFSFIEFSLLLLFHLAAEALALAPAYVLWMRPDAWRRFVRANTWFRILLRVWGNLDDPLVLLFYRMIYSAIGVIGTVFVGLSIVAVVGNWFDPSFAIKYAVPDKYLPRP